MRFACARPCPACPWRRDSHPRDIPNFSLDLAEGLASTSRQGNFGPNYGAPMFACHESVEGAEIACAGWVAVEGEAHPNIRLAVSLGRLDASALSPGEDWPELREDFEEVITALREGSLPRPNEENT